MKTIILELPDDTKLWPQWLETRLVGLDLIDLVVPLRAIEDTSVQLTLQDICGTALPQVLQSGLKALSTSQICSLLKNPEVLLELQELVLSEGSDYWDTVASPDDFETVRERSLARVLDAVRLDNAAAGDGIKTVSSTNPSGAASQQGQLLRWLPVLTLAAGILIAIGILRSSSNTSDGGGWGFDKSGLLTAQLSGGAYLSSLSDAAGTLSKKVPTSKESALKRLREFRAGCKKLIAAPNQQLANTADREWLVTKCNAWLGKIEGHIADIENDKKAWQDVMVEANETANRMQQVLRDKALELT